MLLFEASFISLDFSFSFFSAANAAVAAAWTASGREAGFSLDVIVAAGAEITTFLVVVLSVLGVSDSFSNVLSAF